MLDRAEAAPAADADAGVESAQALVEAARSGDRAALEALVVAIQGRVYNLAVRMLWHPEDAADATQEILIKWSPTWATSGERAAS